MIELYYLDFRLSKFIKTNLFVHNKQIPYGTFVSSAEMIENEEKWRIKIDNEEK